MQIELLGTPHCPHVQRKNHFIPSDQNKAYLEKKLLDIYANSLLASPAEADKFKTLKGKLIKPDAYNKIIKIFRYLPRTRSHQFHTEKSPNDPVSHHRSNDGLSYEVSSSETFLRLNSITLGQGSWKTVKLSVDCLGVLHARAVTPTNALLEQQLLREYDLQKRLSEKSPYFVKMEHYCKYTSKKGRENISFMMEYCDQGTLEEFLKHERDPEKLRSIFQKILEALVILEEEGIYHRDIKPANIFLKSENGQIIPKIGDFGFAIEVNREIQEFQFRGTPIYSSPELLKGYYLTDKAAQLEENAKKLLSEIIVQIYPEDFRKEDLIECNIENLITCVNEIKELDLEENTKSAIHDLFSKVDQSLKEAKDLFDKGVKQGITTKGDMWAAGLILHEMHSQERDRRMPHGEDLPNTFWGKLNSISQNTINECFSKCDLLTQLNALMLDPDPNQRLSAKDALIIFNAISQSSNPFIDSSNPRVRTKLSSKAVPSIKPQVSPKFASPEAKQIAKNLQPTTSKISSQRKQQLPPGNKNQAPQQVKLPGEKYPKQSAEENKKRKDPEMMKSGKKVSGDRKISSVSPAKQPPSTLVPEQKAQPRKTVQARKPLPGKPLSKPNEPAKKAERTAQTGKPLADKPLAQPAKPPSSSKSNRTAFLSNKNK